MADQIDALVAALAKELQGAASPVPQKAAAPKPPAKADGYTRADYPMLEKHADSIRTPTGKPLSALTLEAVLNGDVTIQDVRISKEMLYAQGEIAADAGKPAMGESLKRAAELTQVPDGQVIKMYDKLRPNRSTKAELDAMAQELEAKYNAPLCAAMVREAAQVYEKRGVLADSVGGAGGAC